MTTPQWVVLGACVASALSLWTVGIYSLGRAHGLAERERDYFRDTLRRLCTCEVRCGDTPEKTGGTCKGLRR